MAKRGTRRIYPESAMRQFSITALQRQLDRWQQAADDAGMNRAAWIRKACDQRVADAERRKKR